MWPKTTASTAAGRMKNKNPQIRLAMARALVCCGPYCGAGGCCNAGCGAGACGVTNAVGENCAPQLPQNAATSSFSFVQAGQTFMVPPNGAGRAKYRHRNSAEGGKATRGRAFWRMVH